MPVAVDVLKSCPLFAGFTDTGLEIISQIARLRDVPKGMSVFLQGAPGDALYIVDEGCIEIVTGLGPSPTILCTVEKGGHFGELALVRPGNRAVGARARVPTKVVEIKRADFNEVLKQKPQAGMKLMLAIFLAVDKRLEAVKPELLKLAGV